MRDPAEERFESYLSAHGYAFDYEPDLGGSAKRPDYLLHRGDISAVAEVKGFETEGIWKQMRESSNRVAYRSVKEMLAPVRSQMAAAAKQLKPFVTLNLPLVIVLANPRQAGVELDPTMVIAAMYGDLQAELSVEPGAAATSEWVAGRNGKLTNDHPYISAVVVAHAGDRSSERADAVAREFMAANPDARPDEAMAALREAAGHIGEPEPYPYCHVFEAVSDECCPLPDSLFNGPDDARWRARNGVMIKT